MNTSTSDEQQTKTRGAVKGGNGRYVFELAKLAGIEAGTGYSTATGPVVEGERIHYTIATPDEDVVFFAVKDMSHGIIGIAVDPAKGAFTGQG